MTRPRGIKSIRLYIVTKLELMDQELDKLIRFIGKNFAIDDKKYPDLKDQYDVQAVFKFALRHVVLHMAKATGMVATASERFDHGKEFDVEVIKDEATSNIINGLKLAELFKISGAELIERMEKKYNDKIDDN